MHQSPGHQQELKGQPDRGEYERPHLQQPSLIEDSPGSGPVPWMCRHQLLSRRSSLRALGWDILLDVISSHPQTSLCISSAQKILLFVRLTNVLYSMSLLAPRLIP